jgi:hypothetical protein
MLVEIAGGGQGWVIYHAGEFQLSHIVVEVLEGDPAKVSAHVLRALHRSYPSQDAVMENLPDDSPYWPGFLSVGYFEAFKRLEMVRPRPY